jgi:hypothetical protein
MPDTFRVPRGLEGLFPAEQRFWLDPANIKIAQQGMLGHPMVPPTLWPVAQQPPDYLPLEAPRRSIVWPRGTPRYVPATPPVPLPDVEVVEQLPFSPTELRNFDTLTRRPGSQIDASALRWQQARTLLDRARELGFLNARGQTPQEAAGEARNVPSPELPPVYSPRETFSNDYYPESVRELHRQYQSEGGEFNLPEWYQQIHEPKQLEKLRRGGNDEPRRSLRDLFLERQR